MRVLNSHLQIPSCMIISLSLFNTLIFTKCSVQLPHQMLRNSRRSVTHWNIENQRNNTHTLFFFNRFLSHRKRFSTRSIWQGEKSDSSIWRISCTTKANQFARWTSGGRSLFIQTRFYRSAHPVRTVFSVLPTFVLKSNPFNIPQNCPLKYWNIEFGIFYLHLWQ